MSPLALVSVSDKKNIIPFCKELVEQFNYKILSSGGTAKHLIEAKIPVIKVADFTNSPEILGGRVKTLHPKIHGGILAKRTDEEHKKDIEANNLELIDLVVVNLYRQYQNFLEESKKGELKDSYKAKLALEAFQHTADYDTAISNWIRKERDLQSSKYIESYPLIKTLRYGENPHQKAFWYGLSNIGWNSAEQLQGKDLSYNNLLDLESALSTVLEFGYTEKDELTTDMFASVILKHNNPCGASISNSASKAFLNALECDSVSAFGGIVAFNSNVDSETAIHLKDIFLECVVAPSFDEEALEILKVKKNLRILKFSKDQLPKKNQNSTKSIMGGLLVQDTDDSEEKTENWISVTNKNPSNQINLDLNFAWKICKHVKSNAIVIAKDQKTIGIGAGQMNRVGAAKIALEAAGRLCTDAVLASDGFFPFADTVELANKYGIKAIIQPGGSLRDQESIDMCNSKGISMVFTQKRHFLH